MRLNDPLAEPFRVKPRDIWPRDFSATPSPEENESTRPAQWGFPLIFPIKLGTLISNVCFGLGEAPKGGRVAAANKEGTGAMTKLDQLYAEKRSKFDQICALLARELGLGEFAMGSAEERNRVELEAEQRVKEWEETTEFRTRANIRPLTPLRRLLSQHQLICETILDQQEIELVVLAYKKRARRPASI